MSHIPVLLDEAINALMLKEGDVFVDATLGKGGHSKEICRLFGKKIKIVGIDVDSETIDSAKIAIEETGCEPIIINGNFRNLKSLLETVNIKKINAILFDLGWNTDQLNSGRGLSFMRNDPLLMNLKKTEGEDLTARDIVNDFSEEALSDVFFAYGDERFGRRIAREIVLSREKKSIETTFDLLEIIRRSVPHWYRKGKTHFATKTFQALRIAVNDEFRALNEGLKEAWEVLEKEGRMVVISFHSGEDRIVKIFMKNAEKNKEGILINKKPITASQKETRENPRSRSAKLRIIKKR